MEIKISQNDKHDLLNKNRIRWTLYSRKNLLIFTFYAALGCLFLIGSAVTQKIDHDFWGIGSSLGLSFIFLSGFYFSHTFQNKRKFIQRTKDFLRYSSQDQLTEIIFGDEQIKYKDLTSYSELKWAHFRHYLVYKNYLFLIIDNLFLNALVVHKTEVSEKEFIELVDFCKRKLPLRNSW